MEKLIKKNKTLKGVMISIRVIVAVIFVGFLLVVCLQRFSNNQISFFDYRMFNVVTGSMAPRYNVGDVLISKEVDPSEIKVGDTISYLGKNGTFRDKVITHEVVGIDQDESGRYIYRAKGLANIVEDPIVSEDQIYGIVIYKSLILSTIYRIVGTTVGFFLLIILPLMFIVGSEIIITLLNKEEKRRGNISNT